MIIRMGLNVIIGMAEISIQRLHGLIMAKRSTVERQSTLENLHRSVPKELPKSFTVGTTTNPPNRTQEEQDDAEYLANEPNMTPREISPLLTMLGTHPRPEQGSLNRLILVWMDRIMLDMTWFIVEKRTVRFLAIKLILADSNQGNLLLDSPEPKCGSLDKMDLYLSLSQEITLVAAISIGQKNLYVSISREITLAEANQDHQMDLYLSLYLSLQEITLAEANQDHQMDLYLLSQEITLAKANQEQMDLYLSLLQEITLATALSLLQETLAMIMSPKAHFPALSLLQETLATIMSPKAHFPGQIGLKTAILAVISLFGLNSPPCHQLRTRQRITCENLRWILKKGEKFRPFVVC